MIKAVGINDSMRFGAFKNVKNWHAQNNINNNVERNNTVKVEEKPLLLASFLQPQKSLSFKATVYETTPDDWVEQLGGVVTDDGVNEKYSYSYSAPMDVKLTPATALIDDNDSIGNVFPFFTTKEEHYGHSYPIAKLPVQQGFLYVNGGGKSTVIPFEEVDLEKKIPNVDKEDKAQIVREQLVSIYEKDGKIAERNDLFERNKFYLPENIEKQIDYLIDEGRSDEAMDLYPDLSDEINSQEKEVLRRNFSIKGFIEDPFEMALLNEDIEEILSIKEKDEWYHPDRVPKYKYPSKLSYITNEEREAIISLIKDKDSKPYEKVVHSKKKKIKASALDKAMGTTVQSERIPLAIASFGYSELLYWHHRLQDGSYNIKTLSGIDYTLSKILYMMAEAKQRYNEFERASSYELVKIEEVKNGIKQDLKNVLLNPIEKYKDDSRDRKSVV